MASICSGTKHVEILCTLAQKCTACLAYVAVCGKAADDRVKYILSLSFLSLHRHFVSALKNNSKQDILVSSVDCCENSHFWGREKFWHMT